MADNVWKTTVISRGKILEGLTFNEISRVLKLKIPVLTNFCLFHMRYTNHLMIGLMLEVFF